MRGYAQSAFTLVELMITIVVMVILLGLGTVSISGLQAQARDKERKQDVESIARGLEEAYKRSNPVVTSTEPAGIILSGAYPGLREMFHALGFTNGGNGSLSNPTLNPKIPPAGGYILRLLPGTTAETLKPPSGTGNFRLITCPSGCDGTAANTTALRDSFDNPSGAANAYKDHYVYEPVGIQNKQCWDRAATDGFWYANSPCVRFNIYWISETDRSLPPSPYPAIPGLKVVKSRHQ